MVAIQNWNNYMNAINTAVTFASSILSLTLPDIVEDFLPKPVDNITPLISFAKLFTTIVSVVPFTGGIATAKGAVTPAVNFLIGLVKPPSETDKFVIWSDISISLSTVVQDYQASVSSAFDNILVADPLDPKSGIAHVVAGGGFLGVSQNFTQADLQKNVIDVVTRFAIGQTMTANGIYVLKFHNAQPCLDDDTSICVQDGASNFNVVLKQANFDAATDASKLLREKYGLTTKNFLTDVLSCWEKNAQKSLAVPFKDVIPLSVSETCVFNLPVCDLTPGELEPGSKDFIDHCAKFISKTSG